MLGLLLAASVSLADSKIADIKMVNTMAGTCGPVTFLALHAKPTIAYKESKDDIQDAFGLFYTVYASQHKDEDVNDRFAQDAFDMVVAPPVAVKVCMSVYRSAKRHYK